MEKNIKDLSTYEKRIHLRKLCKSLLKTNISSIEDCIVNQCLSNKIDLTDVFTREDLEIVSKKILANSLIFLANEILVNIESETKLINKTFKK